MRADARVVRERRGDERHVPRQSLRMDLPISTYDTTGYRRAAVSNCLFGAWMLPNRRVLVVDGDIGSAPIGRVLIRHVGGRGGATCQCRSEVKLSRRFFVVAREPSRSFGSLTLLSCPLFEFNAWASCPRAPQGPSRPWMDEAMPAAGTTPMNGSRKWRIIWKGQSVKRESE